MCSSSPPPPDYTPVANASKEAAETMAQLGREQLAESQRQYNQNYAAAQPVFAAQLASMNAGLQQGQDYYDYLKQYSRPVETSLYTQAMQDSQGLQDAAAARAAADARAATTQQQNQLIRQGLRYGWSPQRLAVLAGSTAGSNAQAQAAAATQAREREKQTAWAKQLDVAGLYRNLPGASQGAYGLAVGAGSSALNSQMAPGAQYMQGMAQGANTIGSGQAMKLSGLGNILNAQTSVYNTGQQSGLDIGSLMQGGAALYTAFM